MFNLEQAIAEWRQQMLAAGIKSPAPLEELESHLRQEIERQMKAGMAVQQAFEMTVSQIGQANELKAEFEKDQEPMKARWLWAVFWMALCSWVFVRLYWVVASYLAERDPVQVPFFIFLTSYVVIYVAVLLGSVRYFRGAKAGWNFIETLESKLFRKPAPEHLFLGWFAAGFTLWIGTDSLNYFAFFRYHPIPGSRCYFSPIPIWYYLIVPFYILVAEVGIWALVKASYNKASRFISLVGSVFLIWIAFVDYFENPHPVLIETQPYHMWFQLGQMAPLLMPAFFVIWRERQRIRERVSLGQRNQPVPTS